MKKIKNAAIAILLIAILIKTQLGTILNPDINQTTLAIVCIIEMTICYGALCFIDNLLIKISIAKKRKRLLRGSGRTIKYYKIPKREEEKV